MKVQRDILMKAMGELPEELVGEAADLRQLPEELEEEKNALEARYRLRRRRLPLGMIGTLAAAVLVLVMGYTLSGHLSLRRAPLVSEEAPGDAAASLGSAGTASEWAGRGEEEEQFGLHFYREKDQPLQNAEKTTAKSQRGKKEMAAGEDGQFHEISDGITDAFPLCSTILGQEDQRQWKFTLTPGVAGQKTLYWFAASEGIMSDSDLCSCQPGAPVSFTIREKQKLPAREEAMLPAPWSEWKIQWMGKVELYRGKKKLPEATAYLGRQGEQLYIALIKG